MIINKVCLTTTSRHFSAVICHGVVKFKSWSGWILVVVGLDLGRGRIEFRLLVGRIEDEVGRIKFRVRLDQI